MHWSKRPEDFNIKYAAEDVLQIQKMKPTLGYDGRFRQDSIKGQMQEILLETHRCTGLILKEKDLILMWKKTHLKKYLEIFKQKQIRHLKRQRELIDQKIAQMECH